MWLGADSSLLVNKLGVRSSSPTLNLSNDNPYWVEFLSITGACKKGEVVLLFDSRVRASELAHFNDELLNKFWWRPLTELLVPPCTKALRLFEAALKLGKDFPGDS